MKHQIIYSCVFFIILILPVGSQELPGNRNFTDGNGYKQGLWERKYPNGNLQYRGTFRNDHPVGEFIRYFPDGNKMAEMNFCDSGIRAEALLYYQNGLLAAQGVYVDEKKDSVWKYFSFYDKRLASMETYADGIKAGLSAVYYSNGQFSETFWYEAGNKNGPWMQYYENGNTKMKAIFENDQRHGDFKFYTSSGNIEISGKYYRNQMHGEWIWYDESGNKVSVVEYFEGKPLNEDELIDKEQEMFRRIEEMRGRIPEPDESELFIPRGY
jgi:antitoxin component YwqK of YwqJK toxin-antitoxin module